MKTNIKKIY